MQNEQKEQKQQQENLKFQKNNEQTNSIKIVLGSADRSVAS